MSELPGPVVSIQGNGENSKPVYSSKYILQTRNEKGYIITLGTYDHEVRPEEVVQQFGPRSYTLKKVSPRFAVAWKYQSAKKPESATSDLPTLSQELDRLKKRTKANTFAVVGLGIVTAAGFALCHQRFSSSEIRLGRLEAVAKTIGVRDLPCPGCGNPLDFMLQRFCAFCGIPLNWPVDRLQTTSSSLGLCRCGHPRVVTQRFCQNCGLPHFAQLRFVPAGASGN